MGTTDKLRSVLKKNRTDADKLAAEKGIAETRRLLVRAQKDLERRIAVLRENLGEGDFSIVRLRAALVQVKHVVLGLTPGLTRTILSGSKDASELAVKHTIDYLKQADDAFRGVGTQPLALNEARMMDVATKGLEASVLRRLASSGEPTSSMKAPAPAKAGVLDRYGMEVIKQFETEMQKGLIAKKSMKEIADDITAKSPFLQGAPAHWADRIVRSELMGAYNASKNEATIEANEQLGDVVKILSATFDDRTASDSYAVHGQVRRPEEAFDTWYGPMMHPPARPNDREIVVTHRISWPFPPYLKWKTDGEVAARWAMEHAAKKHRTAPKPMPGRPLMTTVPLSRFGKPRSKKS